MKNNEYLFKEKNTFLDKLKSYIKAKKIQKVYKSIAKETRKAYLKQCEERYGALSCICDLKPEGSVIVENDKRKGSKVIVYTDKGPIMKTRTSIADNSYTINYCGYMPDEICGDYKYINTSCKYELEKNDIVGTGYKTAIRTGRGKYATNISDEFVKSVYEDFAKYFAEKEEKAVKKTKQDLLKTM